MNALGIKAQNSRTNKYQAVEAVLSLETGGSVGWDQGLHERAMG